MTQYSGRLSRECGLFGNLSLTFRYAVQCILFIC